MNIEEYKTELADCLYFGPWSECNPEKALTLIRMAELDLLDPELAELYCCYVHTCFDNSIKYGDQSKDYYEKAILIFDKLIALLDRQGTDDVFRSITGKVETIIKHASQTTGWASGYECYLSEKWYLCRWCDPDEDE